MEIPILLVVLGNVTEWTSALRRRAPEFNRAEKGRGGAEPEGYIGGGIEGRESTEAEGQELLRREKRDGKTRGDHGSMGVYP